MGLYGRFIFPWLMEVGLGQAGIETQRRAALASASGRVLEIGFGFGGSLRAYPDAPGRVADLVALEPHAGLLRRSARRLAGAPFPVRRLRASATALPFPARSFDTVVTHFTLCSLPRLDLCLSEIARVLRIDGRYLFLEHGRAWNPDLARWQARLAPVFRVLGVGCRPDVPIDRVIQRAGLRLEALHRYDSGIGPRVARQMYRGSAQPPAVTRPAAARPTS